MRFDDFAADGQTQAQAHHPRGEKSSRPLPGGLIGEAGPVILNFNLKILSTVRRRPCVQVDIHRRRLRVRLQGVEQDFRQRVFQRGAITRESEGRNGFFAAQRWRLSPPSRA